MTKHIALALITGFLTAGGPVESLAQRCSNTSVGLIPINDLGTGTYGGWRGGLYPGGENDMPTDHLAAGMALASQVQPLNVNGQPDAVAGKIVLLAIGMSNSWQEFAAFEQLTTSTVELNPALVIVNGAQPGKDINVILTQREEYWANVRDSLAAHGTSALQVQAIWLKQAEAYPMFNGNDTTFHGYVDGLKAKFQTVVNLLRTMFPNARLCYMASRTYGGYANLMLNPEPFAYYTGWSVKRLVEDQINGNEELSYDGPTPRAPWLSWGQYLWADGLVPRSDGLIWECADFQQDGTHPSESGEIKIARELLRYFSTASTTRTWFLTPGNGLPCGEIDFFNAFCNGNGSALGVVRMMNSTEHAGKSVVFILDESEYMVELTTNGTHTIGKLLVPHIGPGQHMIELADPAGCFEPITFACPTEAGLRDRDDLIGESNEFQTALMGNFPNPLNPGTTIRYVLAKETHVSLRVYNVMGQEIVALVDDVQSSGEHSVPWDGRTQSGNRVASGIYVYRFVSDDLVATARMVILR